MWQFDIYDRGMLEGAILSLQSTPSIDVFCIVVREGVVLSINSASKRFNINYLPLSVISFHVKKNIHGKRSMEYH